MQVYLILKQIVLVFSIIHINEYLKYVDQVIDDSIEYNPSEISSKNINNKMEKVKVNS